MNMRLKGIKTKLFVTMLLSLVVSAVYSVLLVNRFSNFVADSIFRATEAQLSAQSEIISLNASAAIVFEDEEFAQNLLETLAESDFFAKAAFYLQNGRMLAVYPAKAADELRGASLSGPRISSDETIFISKNVVVNDEVVGRVDVYANASGILTQLHQQSLIGLVVLLVLLILVLLSTWYFQQMILRPLEELTHISNKISSSKDYSLRIKITSQDEVSELSNSFNHMIGEIQARDASLEKIVLERTKELRFANQKLQKLSTTDALTGLMNRSSFEYSIQELICKHESKGIGFCLMFIDLDNFKNINDTLGHSLGDELLRVIASRMASSCKYGDQFFRFGGDEFVALLPGITKATTASIRGAELRSHLSEEIRLQGNVVTSTASIGISLMPDHGLDTTNLIKRADIALYRAKYAGRDKSIVFSSEMETRVNSEASILQDFRAALKSEDFELYLQGIHSTQTGLVSGYEVLTRWNSRGVAVSPREFISCAEKNHLISRFNFYILSKACCLASEAIGDSSDIYLSINFCVSDISSDGFADHFERILSSSGFPASKLAIEINENAFMDDSPKTLRTLDSLRALGIQVFLDDFGQGFSCLSYLRKFSIDAIKIDREFISGVADSESDAKLVKALLSLRDVYGLNVIAEGVETQEQLKFLTAEGCDMCQGFYLHRPEPFQHALRLLEAQAEINTD